MFQNVPNAFNAFPSLGRTSIHHFLREFKKI